MIRDIFTNKWIIRGLGFLILFTTAYVFWIRHDRAVIDQFVQEAVDARRQLQQSETKRKSDTGSTATTAPESPAEHITPTAEKPITETFETTKTPETVETKPTQAQAEASAQAAETEDVPVSPHGFGPYPEVPDDLRSIKRFKPVWEYKKWPNVNLSDRMELLDRVVIKAWKEGTHRDWIGIGEFNGKFYFNYPNTVHVWFDERDPGDKDTRYISGMDGMSLTEDQQDQILRGKTLLGVRVLDGETGGIDPYEYLNLPR